MTKVFSLYLQRRVRRGAVALQGFFASLRTTDDRLIAMRRIAAIGVLLCVVAAPAVCQERRLWVLRGGEMVEYDASTFAQKRAVKIPPEAVKSATSLSVNLKGQILFAPAVAFPVPEGDLPAMQRVWLWNGAAGSWMDRGARREVSSAGSNTAISESAPQPFLAADGTRLYWFANDARRLQRDGVDLSTATQWLAWSTGLDGKDRQEIARTVFKDCRCATGGCEETCAHGEVAVSLAGVDGAFLYTEVTSGQTQAVYQTSTRYMEDGGKWSTTPVVPALRRVLDVSGQAVIEALPDTGCCGWANQSNDQTFLRLPDRTVAIFDEQISFGNADYDVSFFTANARVAAARDMVAITIASTGQPNRPIQLAEQGQGDAEEMRRIRKALAEMPAVEVKSVSGPVKRLAYVPHAALVGWISEKEILIVEDHVLVAYNVMSGARRKSTIRVEDAEHVFLP